MASNSIIQFNQSKQSEQESALAGFLLKNHAFKDFLVNFGVMLLEMLIGDQRYGKAVLNYFFKKHKDEMPEMIKALSDHSEDEKLEDIDSDYQLMTSTQVVHLLGISKRTLTRHKKKWGLRVVAISENDNRYFKHEIYDLIDNNTLDC